MGSGILLYRVFDAEPNGFHNRQQIGLQSGIAQDRSVESEGAGHAARGQRRSAAFGVGVPLADETRLAHCECPRREAAV